MTPFTINFQSFDVAEEGRLYIDSKKLQKNYGNRGVAICAYDFKHKYLNETTELQEYCRLTAGIKQHSFEHFEGDATGSLEQNSDPIQRSCA